MGKTNDPSHLNINSSERQKKLLSVGDPVMGGYQEKHSNKSIIVM